VDDRERERERERERKRARKREREGGPVLGIFFDHICILVMKFAPGAVISVYLTGSRSLRSYWPF